MIIFEAYKGAYKDIDTSVCATTDSALGFVNQIRALQGYDPMSLSPIFAATQRITNAIAQMPWELKSYEDIDIPKTHYFYSLFDNCIQTRFMFVKSIINDVIAHGNGYALIVRDPETAKPKSLIYLPYGTCTPLYQQSTGKLVYNVPLYNNNPYLPIDILHFFMYSNDGISGISLFSYANNSIRLSGYTEKAAMDYFATGMRLTGVLSSDAPRLTDKQREDIRKNYLAGIGSQNGIAVLEAGMKFSQLSNSAKDGQLIDSRLYNIQEIGRFFNISPVLLGDLSHTQYGSVESAGLDFVSNTLAPWTKMIEEEINRKLIMPNQKHKYYIDLNEDVLIKSDRNSFASYLTTLLSNGIISVNESRERLGLSKIENGDVYTIPYSGQKDSDGNVTPSYNNNKQADNQQNKEKNNNNKEDEKN